MTYRAIMIEVRKQDIEAQTYRTIADEQRAQFCDDHDQDDYTWEARAAAAEMLAAHFEDVFEEEDA